MVVLKLTTGVDRACVEELGKFCGGDLSKIEICHLTRVSAPRGRAPDNGRHLISVE